MKKGNYLLIVVVAFLTLGSMSCTYYTSPGEHEIEIIPPDPAYIGSDRCEVCHQDIYGTSVESGHFVNADVECESCHGMGSVHEFTRSAADIAVTTDAILCAECHSINEDHTIAAADGFILNFTQYDEMVSAGHNNLDCVTCHDPHVSVKYGETSGIVKACTECHTDINNPTHNGADCLTCHMSYTTKSTVNTNKYVADVRTHIFKINTAQNGKMFNLDGTIANGSTGVTLDYVCYQCHKDLQGIGGTKSVKTYRQLSAKATDFHK